MSRVHEYRYQGRLRAVLDLRGDPPTFQVRTGEEWAIYFLDEVERADALPINNLPGVSIFLKPDTPGDGGHGGFGFWLDTIEDCRDLAGRLNARRE